MMQRDNEGFIISKLPETAVFLKGLECLVIPQPDGFPEYTPDAYNCVNRYFRNLNLNFDIDNLNNTEWNDLTSGYEILEVQGICRIACKNDNSVLAHKLKEQLKTLETSDSFEKHLFELTILDVCISYGVSDIHIELPYCTVEKISKRNFN